VLLLRRLGGNLQSEFTLWHIPPLQPVIGIPEKLDYNHKILTLHSPNQYCFPSSQSAWFRSHSDYTSHIDLIGIANHSSNGIARYLLKHISRSADPYLPPFIPTLTSQFLVHLDSPKRNQRILVEEFESIRLWDGSALALWVEAQSLVGNLSEISPISAPWGREWEWGSGKSTSVVLYDTIEQRRKGAVTICPTSGRVCVISSNEVHILDYITPSE
jgi:hypothetical protein